MLATVDAYWRFGDAMRAKTKGLEDGVDRGGKALGMHVQGVAMEYVTLEEDYLG